MRPRLFILALLTACALASPAAASAQSVSVSSPTAVTEGDSGNPELSFEVELHGQLLDTVSLSIEDVTTTAADHGAPSPTSLAPLTQGVPQTVTVPVTDDQLDENSPETFKLKADALVATDGEGTGSIIDDDPLPSLTIGNSVRAEGSSGSSSAVFPVSLSAVSGRPISVDYNTLDGSAQQPSDYLQTTGQEVIPAGSTGATISVPVVPDIRDEPNEFFRLQTTNPQNVTYAAGERLATIVDDDFSPFARIDVNPQRAFVGKVVEFDGSRSTSLPPGRPLLYTWDLDGNGSFEEFTGTESAIGLAFFGPGTQFVGLRVTDPGGNSGTASASVDIFPAPPGAVPDTTPPATKLFPGRRSLTRALRRGLRVRLGCSEACFIKATAGVDRRTGRSVGLSGKRRTIGRASSAMPKAGSKVLTFKLSRLARRRLAEVKKVRVNLRFKVRDAALNARTVNHKITLRR